MSMLTFLNLWCTTHMGGLGHPYLSSLLTLRQLWWSVMTHAWVQNLSALFFHASENCRKVAPHLLCGTALQQTILYVGKRYIMINVRYRYCRPCNNIMLAGLTCRSWKSSLTLPMFFFPTNWGEVSMALSTWGGTALSSSGPPLPPICLHAHAERKK